MQVSSLLIKLFFFWNEFFTHQTCIIFLGYYQSKLYSKTLKDTTLRKSNIESFDWSFHSIIYKRRKKINLSVNIWNSTRNKRIATICSTCPAIWLTSYRQKNSHFDYGSDFIKIFCTKRLVIAIIANVKNICYLIE